MKIRNLFQKTICSLITIIYVSKDKTIKQEASKYLRDLVYQYDKYVKHKNVYELGFKYNSDDIEDFMYRCMDLKIDVMRKAENMFFVFDDLMIAIIKERNLHNS